MVSTEDFGWNFNEVTSNGGGSYTHTQYDKLTGFDHNLASVELMQDRDTNPFEDFQVTSITYAKQVLISEMLQDERYAHGY